jgi:XTP/dITP diphosphohydrolase
MRALLASRNPGKLRELRAAHPGWELEPLDADDYPPETGETYYENARAKAEFGRSRAPGEWVLGEDSGLEVAGLGGAPGIKSARFAGDMHVERLLAELEDVEAAGRRARYVCELVALSPGGEELRGTGILEGRIATEPAGSERRVEARQQPSRPSRGGAQASPGTASRSSFRPRARHQLTSAPRTIAFAIT